MRRLLFSNANLLIIAVAMILSINYSTQAQEINGTIFGTVRDSSGAAVSGATVTIADNQKSSTVVRTLTTNEEGSFSAPNLSVSVYTITVEAPNFKKTVTTDVKVDVGQRRTVDFALEAGKIEETVTIEAEAVAVNLTTPTAGTIISGDQVRELSVNNRNFVQLITLSPGVSSNLSDQVYVGTTNPDGQANTVSISINGSRSSQNTYTVDGADITDRGSNLTIQTYPSVDSIGEFKVLRSLYPAESGRSGGGQVNIVTRSGTDKFHGSLFEFVRNDKFNANSYFNNQNAPLGRDSNGKAKRTPFRYNNYGFTVGGPIYFLKFGERDPDDSFFGKMPRTYFFFSEEQRRDIRYPSLSSTVPNASLRQGIFPIDICLSAVRTSASAATCSNILMAGTPFTSRAAINPVSQAYVGIYNQLPNPNQVSTVAGIPGYGLVFPAINTSKFRQEIFKIDTSITNNLTAFYRFENDIIPTLEANSLFSNGTGLPGVATTQTESPGRTHTLQATYIVSPQFIVEARYSHSYGAILSSNVGLLATANTNIPVNLAYPNQRDRIPTLTGNGFSNFAGFGPYNNFSNKNDYSASVTYIFGNHTTKFGATFSKYRKNENALAGNNEGLFSGFLNTTAASAQQSSVCAPSQQNTSSACVNASATNLQAYANFLLGTNASYSQAKSDYTADFIQRNFEGFGQDEYRFRKNITLYYGVRYSFFGSPYAQNGLLTNFVPELYDATKAPLVNGAGNRVVGGNFCNGLIVNSQNYQTAPNGCNPIISPYGKYVVQAPKKNFAPRVGLAWDPFGDGKTSIRTGYGIYHEQTLVGIFEQNLISNPPYQETTSLSQIALNQSFATNPLATLGTISVRGEDTDWKTPYMQQWSFDVQRQLFKNTVLDVGYYGSKGTHLIGIVDINLLPPGFAVSRGATGCATGTSTTPTVACQVAGTAFTSAAQENILDQIRPFRGYKAVNIIKPKFNSNYHSLQIAFEQRLSGKSQFNVAYTFSKNLTDNQTDRSSAPQNTYDIKSEYGRAQLDRRHIFVANYIYEIPFFLKSEGLTRLLLGGWQTSGIFNYQTGLPLTATTSNYDPAGLGLIGSSASGARPNQIGNPNSGAVGTQQQFFNISAFQTVFSSAGISNTPGSTGRGVIEGPRTVRFDFSLMKNFHFTESMSLQLRGEAFNIFNTTNFTTVNTNASQAAFGQVTGTRDPRTIQFGAKFYF
ncbi:MAG: carboxypeptidase regulatory-like domain-containing protein [Actinomycetota bacterium]